MLVGQVVPEDLAAMPPGPELAAVLDGLEHQAVPNDDIVEVLEAQSRQLAHDQARMFSAMNEVLHRLPAAGPGAVRRGSGPGQFAADEVRAALVWSRRFADSETDLAFALVVGLPLVQRDLLHGRIDRGKAAVFADHLINLSAEQAEAICRRVLPVAPGLTPWQIADRIKKLILELDPEYYQRRYNKAVEDRKVVAYLDADGAAVITGSGLPAEDAAAAVERIDQLARATRRAGHPSTLDQLRADVFLGLLDGSLHGLSRDGIIAALLARAVSDVEPGGSCPSDSPAEAGASPDPDGPDPVGAGPSGAGQTGAGAAVVPADDLVDGAVVDGARNACRDDGPVPDRPGGAGPDPGEPQPGGTEAAPDARPHESGPRDARAGVEVRVALSTLLGSDQRPGEIPGLGPVPATVARTLVARQRRAEWRWSSSTTRDAGSRMASRAAARLERLEPGSGAGWWRYRFLRRCSPSRPAPEHGPE